MKNTQLLFLAAMLIAATVSPAICAEGFPLREKYVKENYITTDELAAAGPNAVVVDVRDATEFAVIHVDGAVLLPVESLTAEAFRLLRPDNDPRKIAVYCNGVTCEKSYRAAAKARFWEIPNVFVYDAGIFEWALAHPQRTIFFGKQLTTETVITSLIPVAAFEAACLSPAEFKTRTADTTYKVYDIRERSDRIAKPITLNGDIRLTLDGFAEALAKGEIPKSKLLIYDNVGRQVVWLQYYLEKHGIKDYYFLKGGVRALN